MDSRELRRLDLKRLELRCLEQTHRNSLVKLTSYVRSVQAHHDWAQRRVHSFKERLHTLAKRGSSRISVATLRGELPHLKDLTQQLAENGQELRNLCSNRKTICGKLYQVKRQHEGVEVRALTLRRKEHLKRERHELEELAEMSEARKIVLRDNDTLWTGDIREQQRDTPLCSADTGSHAHTPEYQEAQTQHLEPMQAPFELHSDGGINDLAQRIYDLQAHCAAEGPELTFTYATAQGQHLSVKVLMDIDKRVRVQIGSAGEGRARLRDFCIAALETALRQRGLSVREVCVT